MNYKMIQRTNLNYKVYTMDIKIQHSVQPNKHYITQNLQYKKYIITQISHDNTKHTKCNNQTGHHTISEKEKQYYTKTIF